MRPPEITLGLNDMIGDERCVCDNKIDYKEDHYGLAGEADGRGVASITAKKGLESLEAYSETPGGVWNSLNALNKMTTISECARKKF